MKACQDMCTMDPSCIAFASNPGDNCWITDENKTISKDNATTNVNAACYEKIRGSYHISQNQLIFCRNLFFSLFCISVQSFMICF